MPTCPSSMFCGLLIMVAAEPMLLAAANPMRNGTGFNLASRMAAQRIGVKARQMMSLVRKADNKALKAITASKKIATGT